MSNSRLLSSAVAVLDVYIFSLDNTKPHSDMGPLLFMSFILLFIPLFLIWFGDEIGGYIGPAGRGGYVDTQTPGWVLATFGWLLLLMPIMGVCFFGSTREHNSLPSGTASSPSSIATPTASINPWTPRPFPQEVALTTPVQMPVSRDGKSQGAVLLPRGTRLQVISIRGDSLVVRFLDSTTTVPKIATDYNEMPK